MVQQNHNWSFYNPVTIMFAVHGLKRLPMFIKGDRVLLVTTRGFTKRGLVHAIKEILNDKIVTVIDEVEPNPDLRQIEEDLLTLKKIPLDMIVALGGGSVLDMAKVFRYLPYLEDPLSLRRHLEQREPLHYPLLPMVAIPTTAGTGSEVTPFATIWDKERRKKYSLTSQTLYPTYALLDPFLTLSLPEEITVSSALDALSHALESVWNKNQNPVTLLYAKRGVELLLKNIPLVYQRPHHIEARTQLLEASLFAGLAISKTRTALSHSISYPLTIHYGLPHGLACGFTLPSIFDFNVERGEGPIHSLTASLGYKDPFDMKEEIITLLHMLNIKERIEKYIPSIDALFSLGEEMLARGRVENNLRPVREKDIEDILNRVVEGFSSL